MTEREPFWDKRRKAQAAIGAIALGVVLFDANCEKEGTISEETYRLAETKLGRFVVPFVILSTAAHLLRAIPEEYDWIHRVAKLSPKNSEL